MTRSTPDASAWLSILLAGLISAACSSSNDTVPAQDVAPLVETPPETNETGGTSDSTSNTDTTARYRLTFDAVWSAETHPLNFPGNPHFSGLVGAVHNVQVRFWEPAQIATPGIQLMAETGGKSLLLSEVQTAIDAGLAQSAIDGSGIGTSPGSTSVEFTVSRQYPEITVTSMLAPSPDWFVGVHNYSLLNNDEFIENATIQLVLYDSGSDNGVRYSSANEDTDPLVPIAQVNSKQDDAPFINGEPVVGSFRIDRL